MFANRLFLALFIFFLLPLSSGFADPAPSYLELQDGPTITVDWSKGNTQAVTLHGDRKLVFVNGRKGEKYTLIITQDAHGSRIVKWPASVRWPGGPPQTGGRPASVLTTTANRKDFLGFFYDGVNYDALSISSNY